MYNNTTQNDLFNYKIDSNNTIDLIINWLSLNNLTVNITKTKIVQFSTSRQIKIKLNINYDDFSIQEANSTILLGLEIDSTRRLVTSLYIFFLLKFV